MYHPAGKKFARNRSTVLILGISKSGGDPPSLHKMWGKAKSSGGQLYDNFKLMKNTFSICLDIFNSGLLLISDQGHMATQ